MGTAQKYQTLFPHPIYGKKRSGHVRLELNGFDTCVLLAHLSNHVFVVVDVGGINIIFLAGGQVVSSRDPMSRDPL